MPKYAILGILFAVVSRPLFCADASAGQPSKEFLLYLATYGDSKGRVFDPNDLHQLLKDVPPPGIGPSNASQTPNDPSPVQTKEPRT